MPVVYKDVNLACGYRLEWVVEDKVIVEVKAIERLAAIHDAQRLSYLRVSGKSVGLIINSSVSPAEERPPENRKRTVRLGALDGE